MNKEFVTYEQALALKELGFDEPCLGFYVDKKFSDNIILEPVTQKYNEGFNYHQNSSGSLISAPLYQQAFKFFREKHGLYIHFAPEFYMTGINFNWQILWYLPKEKWTEYVVCNGTMLFGDNGEYPTQEDAENACLDELIEIVKNKNE